MSDPDPDECHCDDPFGLMVCHVHDCAECGARTHHRRGCRVSIRAERDAALRRVAEVEAGAAALRGALEGMLLSAAPEVRHFKVVDGVAVQFSQDSRHCKSADTIACHPRCPACEHIAAAKAALATTAGQRTAERLQLLERVAEETREGHNGALAALAALAALDAREEGT